MSEFNQISFAGGMNLLADDTRLAANQYRLGLNLRNRYDVLDPIPESLLDHTLPAGIIQELLTFGNYEIAFVSGNCYYKLVTDLAWAQVTGFSMSTTASRYWTVAVPVSTTLYGRVAAATTIAAVATTATAQSNVPIFQINSVASSAAGNLPGLLVQDNVNQPMFVYIDTNGLVQARTTKTYAQWLAVYDGTTGTLTTDEREYVPVGNAMAWVDGVLYVASQDKNIIYRSVSGRPLDFMVNVTQAGLAGGDATTTAYSVGVGNISVLRGMADGSLFVSASNANFIVAKNMTENSPKIFGEYTFTRRFLFEATCLNDRCIIDSLGDTRFIDLTGVRSFNAIQQLQNEGRNAPFTATIQSMLKGIVQDVAAAVLYDNFELYALNTTIGPAIAVFDTIVNCWSSFDTTQTGGQKIKAFAKIELSSRALFAITEDNKLYQLYSASTFAPAKCVTLAIGASALQGTENMRMINARQETKVNDFRCILNRINANVTVTLQLFVDNRYSAIGSVLKTITYRTPVVPYADAIPPDVNSQLTNLFWVLANAEQGWKNTFVLSWTGGSLTQFSTTMQDLSPLNPPMTQTTTI